MRRLLWIVALAMPLLAEDRAADEQEESAKKDAKDAPVPAPDRDIRRFPTLPNPIAPEVETYLSTRRPGDYILRPSTISKLKKEDVRRSGARYPSDVLRLIPGMEVQRVYSTSSNVAVRGFNDSPTTAQGVLSLIDGRQVYNEFLGNTLWDQLMLIPEDIEEIQVVRGPGSFLYGPNAMHGIVNFITKSPLDYDRDEVSVLGSVGTYDSTIGRVRYVKRDQETGAGLLANLVWDDIDQFDSSDGDARDKIYGEVRFEKDLGGGSRNGSPKSDHRLEVAAGVSDQKFDLLLATLDLAGLPPVPSDTYRNQAQETYLTGKYTRGDFVAQATWSGFDSSSAPVMMFYGPFDLDLDTVSVDVFYSFALLQDHELTVGAGYRYATADTGSPDVTMGRHSTNLVSAFLQDEVTLVADALFLTAGLRVDDHSRAGTSVAPRAAVVWKPWRSHSLRLSYGRGHRNPSLFENFLNLPLTLPFGMATIVGNPDLKPEQMDSYELGYRGWFRENRLRIEATGYLNHVDDLVVFEPAGPGTVAPVNRIEYRAYGLELEAEYAFDARLSVFGNYSYGVLEDRGTGERIHAAPRHKGNLGVRWSTQPGKPPGRMDAMLWLTYFDETELSFAGGVVDDYLLLNASVSYEFGEGRSAYLKVFNLLDDDHRENPEGRDYGALFQVGFRFKW